MKRFPSIVLTLLVPLCAQAAPLTPEAALQRALGDAPRRVAGNSGSYRLATTRQSNGSDAIYVFTRPASEGFIVAPADDRAPALLGYGETNLTDENGNIAPGMTYWLDQLARQVEYGASHKKSRRIAKARPEREAITPLCKTLWDQDTPYNNLCPEDNGELSVTGCVATAMSQAMKYHNWPETGEGSIAYDWNGTTLSLDFSGQTFKWSRMLETYTDHADEEQCNAVAELMRAAGYSVEMEYSSYASSARSLTIAPALGNHFRYDKSSLRFIYRDHYSLYDWEEIIYKSLQEDGPVIYDGQSYDGGHSYICDGYSSDGYFHFNWGWGGISDGYFLLDALDPLEQGIGGAAAGFNFMQDAIIGIRPDRTGTSQWEHAVMAYYEPLHISQTVHEGQDALIQDNVIYNTGPGVMHSGTIGLCFQPIDMTGRASGDPIYIMEEIEGPIEVSWGESGYGAYLSEIPDGRYTITMAYTLGDSTEYLPVIGYTYSVTSYILDKTGDDVELTPVLKEAPDFTDVKYPTHISADGDIVVTGTLTNNTGAPYHNFVTALILSEDCTELYALGYMMVVDLEEGESKELKYNTPLRLLCDLPAGQYYLAIAIDGGNGYYGFLSEPELVSYVDGPAGVSNPAVDPDLGHRVYYTIDGVRVAEDGASEPQPTLPAGLYIVKSSSSTSKIIVK